MDVGQLLNGIREYYEASAADNGIALTTCLGDKPVISEMDRTLIQRAVGNLVSNAVAHTPAGGSIILGADAEAAAIRIEVIDTGTGIPAEALPRVFDRFYRVDSSRSKASGGSGLGLAIVQGIMVLHGGKVEIASRLGDGTRVTLRMPAPGATSR